jgi:hypothetical protein
LSFHRSLGLPIGPFPSGLPTKVLYAFRISHMRATCLAHPILFLVTTLKLLIMRFSPVFCHFLLFGSGLSRNVAFHTLLVRVRVEMQQTKFHTHAEHEVKL